MSLDKVAQFPVLGSPSLLPADDLLIRPAPANRAGHAPELIDAFEAEWRIVTTACETFGRLNAPTIDWAAVAEACETMLGNGPKDLRLAGILMAAELFAGRIARLPRAAAAYGLYAASHWSDMPVPARERGYMFSRLVDPMIDALKVSGATTASERAALHQAAGLIATAAEVAAAAPGARPDLAARLVRLARALAQAGGVQEGAPLSGDGAAAQPVAAESPAPASQTAIAPTAVAGAATPNAALDLAVGSAIAMQASPSHARVPPEDQETPPPGWTTLSLTAGDWRARGAADYWPRIADSAVMLLEDGAKDLRAAGLWLLAAWWTRDPVALRRAAAACRVLCEGFWAEMPLPAGRRGAMFLGAAADMAADVALQAGQRQDNLFAQAAFRTDASAAAGHLAAAAAAIGAAGDRDAREGHPKLAAMLARIAAVLADGVRTGDALSAPPPAAAPAALVLPAVAADVSDGPAAPERDATARDAPSEPVTLTGSIPVGEAALVAAMRAFAVDRFSAEPGAKDDWRAFALLRQAVLLPFRRLTVVQGGVERPIPLRGPAAADVARLVRLQNLDAAKDPAATLAMLAKAELAMASFPVWLDHHRVAAEVLGRLGLALMPARAAVIGATATLLLRLPGLAAMQFDDGRPVADEATQRWIGAEVLPGGASAGDEIDGAAEASALADAGRHAEALALLAARRATASSERLRFRIGLLSASLLLRSGQAASAALLLEELLTETGRHGLDRWEPTLAVAALRLQIEALAKDEDDLRQALRATDPRDRLRAEAEVRARDAALRHARGRLGALDPITLFGDPASNAAARPSTR
ncbi:MAG: type VI secretion system domain-containing protein [Roseomonas sp.]|nr:type VI secretion system domain-containing protein [Roseomonas sp.]